MTSARAVLGNSLQAIRLRIFLHDFIHRAIGGADTPASRREIVRRFREVHRHVPCAHQEAELLIVAEAILQLYYYRDWPDGRTLPRLHTTDYRPRPIDYAKRLRHAVTRAIGPRGRALLRRVVGRS